MPRRPTLDPTFHAPVPVEGSRLQCENSGPKDDASFAAHALGQGGQKRGLKGGAPVLDAARKSYLQAQWSGPGDRRMPAGLIRRDEV